MKVCEVTLYMPPSRQISSIVTGLKTKYRTLAVVNSRYYNSSVHHYRYFASSKELDHQGPHFRNFLEKS